MMQRGRHSRFMIGPDKCLRLDPNEKWEPVTAIRMIRKLSVFDIEFVEQPTDCESLSALAQVHASSPVAIAADQLVFTPYDAFNVCREKAADLIVLGLHETGGIILTPTDSWCRDMWARIKIESSAIKIPQPAPKWYVYLSNNWIFLWSGELCIFHKIFSHDNPER